MTTSRLLCVFLAKAAGSGRALAGAGCSVRPGRHVCTSSSRLQSCMSAWCIDRYGSNEVLRFSEEIPMPTVRSPSDVMIQVRATSLNPLDVAMRGKSQARTPIKTLSKSGLVTQPLHVSPFRWLWSQTAEVAEESHVSSGKWCRLPADPRPRCVRSGAGLRVRGHPFCPRRWGSKKEMNCWQRCVRFQNCVDNAVIGQRTLISNNNIIFTF